jgi:nucleotide-binding universal stress UspA family protein
VLIAGDLDQQLRRDAQRSLLKLRDERLPALEHVDVDVLHHPSAAIAICDYAAQRDADLVVVGTHGRTGLAHLLAGSVAEAVVRHAPCSVLAVRPTAEMAHFPRHVLVCTDFSPASEPALRTAAMLARAFESRVTLLHVYVDPPALPGLKDKPYHAFEAVDADIRKALSELERRHFGGAVTTALLVAPNPAEAIASYALRNSADLVVVATRGATGLERLLLGSVAQRVVRHAPCPVLVARG